jgi:hypothetical protein
MGVGGNPCIRYCTKCNHKQHRGKCNDPNECCQCEHIHKVGTLCNYAVLKYKKINVVETKRVPVYKSTSKMVDVPQYDTVMESRLVECTKYREETVMENVNVPYTVNRQVTKYRRLSKPVTKTRNVSYYADVPKTVSVSFSNSRQKPSYRWSSATGCDVCVGYETEYFTDYRNETQYDHVLKWKDEQYTSTEYYDEQYTDYETETKYKKELREVKKSIPYQVQETKLFPTQKFIRNKQVEQKDQTIDHYDTICENVLNDEPYHEYCQCQTGSLCQCYNGCACFC